MLRKVKNLSWKDRAGEKSIHVNLKPITKKIRERCLRLAGHVYHYKSCPANMPVLWQPKYGNVARGKSATTHVDALLKDTELKTIANLHSFMSKWKCIAGFCAESFDQK